MQIFLPYPDFKKSIECLTDKHLNSQKCNCQVLARTFLRYDRWRHHPTYLAWRPYYESFQYYHDLLVDEWLSRGFKTVAVKYEIGEIDKRLLPWFVGIEEFHRAHRSNLIRKDPIYRGKCGWDDPDNLPYLWPNNNTFQLEEIETGNDLYKRMGWSLKGRVRPPGPQPGAKEKRLKKLHNIYDIISPDLICGL